MKMIGSPKNGNICTFFSPNVSRRYAPLDADSRGWGGMEKVRSFVTFFTEGIPYLWPEAMVLRMEVVLLVRN